jgi:signal transduction histidine kinase
MELARRNLFVYVLLAGVWALIAAWQVQEHVRVENYARTSLRNRSKDIADTMGSFIRGLQWGGAVFSDRLQPVLDRLASSPTNELSSSGEVLSVLLLNTNGDLVAKAGNPIDLQQKDLLQQSEHWGPKSLVIAYQVAGVSMRQEGATNPASPFLVDTNDMRRRFPPRRDERRPEPNASSNAFERIGPEGPPPGPPAGPPPPPGGRQGGPRDGGFRRRPPPWWLSPEFQALAQKREMHVLVLAMSTGTYQATCQYDLRLRYVTILFAAISAVGLGLAWRNLAKSSELQIRLVRASELNTHLKEMNLAAAGLAHETRNPLNIIRGLAQMLSKTPNAPVETQEKSREIINEADKVAGQLNEFINYSRPREVRRSRLVLGSVVNEVIRALGYDLEEKKIDLQVVGESISIEADDQLLRQALFNLLLNAIQAVEPGGEIRVFAARRNPAEAVLEIRDNGPGVPQERRTEIFRPYFTTHKTGTGLGLAVVQQIVLAHGWEIECLPNAPKGALFRISHVKLAA